MVRVVTPGDRISGRLVDLDLVRGLTLELSSGDGDLHPLSLARAADAPQLRQVALGSVLALGE